jgi:peptide deformylase
MKPKILRITHLGEPILRKKLKTVPGPAVAKIQNLIDDMMATMKKAQGVGIAANQVNVDQRIFIVAPEPSARYPQSPTMPPLAMINPKVLSASKKMETDWEGCLSIPGLRARVPRHYALTVEFTTRDGQRRRAELRGFVARIFQHENDHINGHVYIDRVQDTRTFMTEGEYRKRGR